jgi:hypothetical protein
MSWVGVLKQARAEALARRDDPWRLRLERIRGKVGYDAVERLSTQAIFDFLEVTQRGRNAGACRRLARVMRELGWTPVRVRDMTRGGYKEQVRGYCRDARCLRDRTPAPPSHITLANTSSCARAKRSRAGLIGKSQCNQEI